MRPLLLGGIGARIPQLIGACAHDFFDARDALFLPATQRVDR
jgi:hypothetical protein